MKNGTVRQIPLQADLCLNRQKVDIEDYKGWQKCNSPVYGDCLSPLYKKDSSHHDIYLGEDYYDFQEGVLSKNGINVLSGAGSHLLKKTKLTDTYSSLKLTEDNTLTSCKETGANSVTIAIGETEYPYTLNNAQRIIATKCFGNSQYSIFGCVVWYLHTSGQYGYFVMWRAGETVYTSYGEDEPTLYSGWKVIAPLIQVAVPANNTIICSMFGNSGTGISDTQVKNFIISDNIVYDNPTFADDTLYPTRYNTIVEDIGLRVHVSSLYSSVTGRDYDSLNDNQGTSCCSALYYEQAIQIRLERASARPITIRFGYWGRDGFRHETNRVITIPAGVTMWSWTGEVFTAGRGTRDTDNGSGSNKTNIGILYKRNGEIVQSFTSDDLFLPPGFAQDDLSRLVLWVTTTRVTEADNPNTAGVETTNTYTVECHRNNPLFTFSTFLYNSMATSNQLRTSSDETLASIFSRYINTYTDPLINNYSLSRAYPSLGARDWLIPFSSLDPSGNGTKYFNTSSTPIYFYIPVSYKEEYTEQALKECDCILDDNRFYCVSPIYNNKETPIPTKLFALAGEYYSFDAANRKLNYHSLATFNISYQTEDNNIYPKYWEGISISLQADYLRIIYKFKKSTDTEDIIYFGIDSTAIRSAEGKNAFLYPGVQKGSDINPQGSCVNIGETEGWRLLFNNNIISNVSCFEKDNYIGTILADWLSIDPDFHITCNSSTLIYKDNSNTIWKIEKVLSGAEWSYRLVENRYIILNTTNYFNCYDTQTGLKRHWSSDYNNRVLYGYGFSQYSVSETFTTLFSQSLFSGLIITGQNANYERTKDPITSIELGALILDYCMKDEITFVDCDTPYGAIEGIDMYRGDDGSTSAAYVRSFQNGLEYIDTDLTNPFAVYPISDTGNVRYNPSLFTKFITSFNNKDMVLADNIAYKLLYFNNVTPIMAFYLLDGVEGLENAFVLQSSYYGVSKTRLYQMNYSNGVGVEVVCDITNLEYLGALPSQALFWSAQNRAIYSFTGSCIMQLSQYANDLTQIFGKWYNPATQELFLDTNIGLLVFSDLGTYCLEWESETVAKSVTDMFFFEDYFIVNLEGDTTESHLYSYNKKTDYESNGIHFITKYYGNALYPQTVNNIYIRLYNEGEVEGAEGTITLKGFTITDKGTETDTKTVAIGGETGEQWDSLTHTLLVKYTPQYNRGLGFALEVNSTFPIVDIKFDYVENGVSESQISHVNV